MEIKNLFGLKRFVDYIRRFVLNKFDINVME